MSAWTGWAFTGGGGALGGGLVTLAKNFWKDKKQIEKEYKYYHDEAIKLLGEAREGYKTVTGDLTLIMEKLEIDNPPPAKELYKR